MVAPPSPHLTVIIPVLNEAPTLPKTLVGLQGIESLEVIVVDGGSQDHTVAIAQALGARVITAAVGRAKQMNAGAAIATGEILIFLHGDTQLPTGFATMIPAALAVSGAIAGAFALQIDAPQPAFRWIEAGVNWRSRWLQRPYGDQALFLNASVFRACGGFPDLPIMEDFEFVRQLARRGEIVIVPTPVVTSARRWQRLGIWQTTLINQGIVVAYLLGVPCHSLAHWYRRSRGFPISPPPG
ncbi:glycosyltransferase [Neosynechococcus sphagnicola sy1]|uniref:4,4'-diaponeurosporenoate glycosyltransferase n=2 Tax=Neosynechococcus TaxID=1501143 RepID=A0A098TJU1_9CYAN|nr:glycosyltransferase [Neosynechococcus sphagnicola sy1]